MGQVSLHGKYHCPLQCADSSSVSDEHNLLQCGSTYQDSYSQQALAHTELQRPPPSPPPSPSLLRDTGRGRTHSLQRALEPPVVLPIQVGEDAVLVLRWGGVGRDTA